MNIGIMIDGVLTNLEQFQFDYGSKFYFEKHMSLKNPRGKSVQEIYRKHGNYLKDTKKEKSFWDIYYEFYLVGNPPRIFSSEIVKKLHEHGNTIYLFCTRTFFSNVLSMEQIKKYTKLWLIQHGIYFDFLVFSDMINVDLIQKYHISLFLDHHPDTIFHLSLHLPVVCFHAKYNELVKGENVYRVFSWYDFYEKLEMILDTEKIPIGSKESEYELSSFYQ